MSHLRKIFQQERFNHSTLSTFRVIAEIFVLGTLWERSIQSASKCQTSSLNVSPKLLGERHAPNELASVSNINPGNLSLGHVFRAICAGIVKNLYR